MLDRFASAEAILSVSDGPIANRLAPGPLAPYRQLLVRSGMLEAVRETVLYPFVLPKKITIEAKSCGEPNAYWDSGPTTLTLCYELMADFAELSPAQ